MPAAIPVKLIHKSFASQNQAKAHYCDILHQYKPGDSVGREHRADLCGLLKSHPMHGKLDSAIVTNVKVTRGRFGRSCFAFDTDDSKQQKFSLIRCISEGSVPEKEMRSISRISKQKKKPNDTAENANTPSVEVVEPPKESKP